MYVCITGCLEAITYYRMCDMHYNAHIFVGIWTDLFTRELDVNKGSYKPESLPPMGTYIFQAVIGNELGNNSHNHSAKFDIPEGEQCDSF